MPRIFSQCNVVYYDTEECNVKFELPMRLLQYETTTQDRENQNGRN